MISTRVLSNIGTQGNALSAAHRDIRTARPRVCPDSLEAAYQSGALHVAAAAPRKYYVTRITLEPEVHADGEYLGVILEWVGNRVYQRAPFVRSATAENTLGLGAL
eukprot:3976501-Pyramimonas_sp.AAC.1